MEGISLENQYLRLSDVEFRLENSKRQLDNRLKKVRAEMATLKLKIVEEYTELGVCPFNLIVKKVPQKLIVTDESKIPDEFFKIERKLEKAKLNKAIKDGRWFEGVTMDNGSYTVSLKQQKPISKMDFDSD